MNSSRKEVLARFVLSYLVDEAQDHGATVHADARRIAQDSSSSFDELWLSIRALMNVRPPWRASPQFLIAQDELLQILIEGDGIRTIADSTPSAKDSRIRLWKGDITRLDVDAIVNAANSGMTGCWAPLHYCIDNAIHTFAGVQLRANMADLMEEQGHEDPTAHARITSAFNLPSKHIIHTVGPIANGSPTVEHRRQLSRCYEACLDLAQKAGCLSIAFCCISTGVFGFPQREAASIAIGSVRRWLDEHPETSIIVVFDVFGSDDEAIYQELLRIPQKA